MNWHISFVDFSTALRARVVNTVYLTGWKYYATMLPSPDSFPSRTMINTKHCMVCNRTGEMEITRVPWSNFPPHSVFVHCPRVESYCKYHALRSMIRRKTHHGSVYRIIINNIFDTTIEIPRSNGTTTLAKPSKHFLVQKKDGQLFIHVTWVEDGELFEKCISLNNSLIHDQLLRRPEIITGLWGNESKKTHDL